MSENQNTNPGQSEGLSLKEQVDNLTPIVHMCYTGVISLFLTSETIYSLLLDKGIFTEEEFTEAMQKAQQEADTSIAEILQQTDEMQNAENKDVSTGTIEDAILSGIQIS